ncbi:MAG: aminotransferase class III-fold pyridoxal phosphate-dependent enzyme [Bacteroidales bacterium]
MKQFEVYKLWPIEPVKGLGCKLWDAAGNEYTDLYGGHAVISVGHSHPVYVKTISDQLNKIGFYSNSVQNSLQNELAERLGRLSGYPDYSLFLCNSGAEANENAIKLASFHTGRKKLLAFSEAFHGRTSGAVAATDNPKIQAPFNETENVKFIALNDIEAAKNELNSKEYCAVIVEGIQGVAGIYSPTADFLKQLRTICDETGTLLILDEVQSGYGRTGKFFAHQHSQVKADLITMAKGMGNGFPIGGVLISDIFKPSYGMLGTTFGGNHLACAAAIAVLKILEDENLMENAKIVGAHIFNSLKGNSAIKDLRGEGLMIGIDLNPEYLSIKERLLSEEKIFTGSAKTNIIRLLPPLNITIAEADKFINSFNKLKQSIENG